MIRKNFYRRKKRVGFLVSKSSFLRLSVFKSNKNIHAQIIDDSLGVTLAYASSTSNKFKAIHTGKKGIEIAAAIGKQIAELALSKGINRVVFDRSGYKFHGRIAALAIAADEAGLKCISKLVSNEKSEVQSGNKQMNNLIKKGGNR